MESFPDRTHVWLWIREYDGYLYARVREDGEEDIACSEERGELHGAWAVHRLVRDGTDYVLFQSSSYGRYLALIDYGDDYGPVQCTYDSPEQVNVLFQAVRANDGSGDIFIRHFTIGEWCDPNDEHTPMRWVVEAIPPRLLPPELPVPPEPIQPPPVPVGDLNRRRFRGVQPESLEVVLRRRINYVRADDQGNFNPLQWRMLQFDGQSVFNLRRDLAAGLGEAENVITLCVLAGSCGRLTPLVIDLPPNQRTMNIVVLTADSPAAQALVYPNVDAP